MRISDWSSDVCSSDLSDPLASAGRALTRHPRCKTAARWHESARRCVCMYGRIEDGTVPGPFKRLVAGLLRGLTSKADSAHVDYLSGDGRRDVSRCADATLRTTQPSRCAHCGRGLARLPRTRSDEHTYDLQSLIRLSSSI